MADRKRVVILSGFKMCFGKKATSLSSFILRLETIQIYLAKRLNGRAADQQKAALVASWF